jgi:zinc ribbon protein
MECPKCGQSVRDIATFCTRCHMTLRFKCPACQNEQRHGGSCDKCGVDFMKFASALMAQTRSKHDAEHDRLEGRSNLLKNVLMIPLTGGFSLLRLLRGSKESK